MFPMAYSVRMKGFFLLQLMQWENDCFCNEELTIEAMAKTTISTKKSAHIVDADPTIDCRGSYFKMAFQTCPSILRVHCKVKSGK